VTTQDLKPPDDESSTDDSSLFQRVADKVSYGMDTPTNIGILTALVGGWTLLFALRSEPAGHGGQRGSPVSASIFR
jgi:hypothetical protein